MFFNKKGILTFLIVTSTALNAIDITPFYRTALFQGEAKRDASNWITYIDAQYAESSTSKAWNTQEVQTDLFNMYGPFDMRKLAANLEDLSDKPNTLAYANGDIPNLYDGKLIFKGECKVEEFNFTIQQNIMYGLYAQLYIPIRKIEIKNIDYCQSVTTYAEHVKLDNFVKNDLDAILAENGIKPLKTPFERRALSDPLFSIGWTGHCTFPNSMINALRGYVQGGVLIPTGSRKRENHIFSMPMGHNKHWGFNARANTHITFWKKFVFGLNGGATIFMKQTYDQRLTTSADQNGYIILEKGRATADKGTQWDITTYLKTERFVGGLGALIGYSYTQQEDTTLVLKDDNVLKTAFEHGTIKNRNEVVNYNKLLKQWYQHVLHAYIEYDFAAHVDRNVPEFKFQVAFHHPFLAKHSFASDTWSGSISAGIAWSF
jgi:hypothetical protein